MLWQVVKWENIPFVETTCQTYPTQQQRTKIISNHLKIVTLAPVSQTYFCTIHIQEFSYVACCCYYVQIQIVT